jgi:hypothetical protein
VEFSPDALLEGAVGVGGRAVVEVTAEEAGGFFQRGQNLKVVGELRLLAKVV